MGAWQKQGATVSANAVDINGDPGANLCPADARDAGADNGIGRHHRGLSRSPGWFRRSYTGYPILKRGQLFWVACALVRRDELSGRIIS